MASPDLITDELPLGFVNHLFSQLATETQFHLLNSLYNLPQVPDNMLLQNVVFSSIDRCDHSFFEGCPAFIPLLLNIVTDGHLYNLTELTIVIQWQFTPGGKSTPITSITKSLSRSLQAMKNLQSLKIYDMKFQDVSLAQVIFPPNSCFPALTFLNLNRPSVNSADLLYFGSQINCFFPSLEILGLSSNNCFGEEREPKTNNKARGPRAHDLSFPNQHLSPPSSNIANLLAWIDPAKMTTLTTLNISNTNLNDSSVLTLSQSPVLAHLTALDLGWNGRVTMETWMKLFLSDSFSKNGNIETLRLDGNRVWDKHHTNVSLVEIISNQMESQFKNLSSLSFNSTNLTDYAVQILSQSTYLTQLTSLDLEMNDLLTDEAVLALSKSPICTNLTALNLHYCKSLTTKSLLYIGQSPYLTNLVKLEFTATDFGRDTADFIHFINSPNLASVQKLIFRSTKLSLQSLQSISNSSHLTNLRHLTIANNPVDVVNPAATHQDHNGETLLPPLPNPHSFAQLLFKSQAILNLSSLQLSNCNLTDDDLYFLSHCCPQMAALRRLNIAFNPAITDVGVGYIIQSPYLTEINSLDISGTLGVTKQTLTLMAQIESIPFLYNLSHLGLSRTSIKEEDHSILSATGYHFSPEY